MVEPTSSLTEIVGALESGAVGAAELLVQSGLARMDQRPEPRGDPHGGL